MPGRAYPSPLPGTHRKQSGSRVIASWPSLQMRLSSAQGLLRGPEGPEGHLG